LDQRGAVLYDPAATLTSMGERLKKDYPLAFGECQQPLPDEHAFVHLFAGLVQMADWLGSDTREKFFPYTAPGEDRTQTAAARAAYAVKSIGLDVSVWKNALHGQPPTFSAAFDVPEARPMQVAAADLSLGNIVVLEAETGSGKTEAALWRFVQLFEADKVEISKKEIRPGSAGV